MSRAKVDLKDLVCPACGGRRTIKKILYGEPSIDFDSEKYIIGGCMPEKATIGCSNCDWAGTRKEIV